MSEVVAGGVPAGGSVGGPARVPAAGPAPEAIARRNFRLGVANGVLFQVGESFIENGTILALFVSHLTNRNWLVGLAVSIFEIGWFLPQALTIHFLEKQRRRLPLYSAMAVVRTGGLVAVTVAIALLGDRDPDRLLAAFLIGFTVYAFAGGFAAVSFFDVVGRTIPLERYPRLWAYRLFYGGICAALCGGPVRAILAIDSFTLRYALLFGIATVFVGLGTGAFSFSIEPPVEVSRKAKHMAEHLREAMQVVWRDRSFVALYATRVALAGAAMATPFFVVYAVRGLGLQPGVVAGFLTAKVVGFVAANPLWQRVAQGRGNRSLFRRVALAATASPLLALGASVVPPPWPGWVLAGAFVLQGAAVSGASIGFQSLLLAIAPAARRPSYVGLMNSFLAPTMALPALAGLGVDFAGPRLVFVLALGCGVIAWRLADRLPRLAHERALEPDPAAPA